MLTDIFGCYETTFTYKEPDNNKTYEFRKYVNSIRLKALGGMYAIYCEDDDIIIFRKSEYLRDRSYSKFSDGKCEDAIKVSEVSNFDDLFNVCKERIDKIQSKKNLYNLPKCIDRSKLTEQEFSELRLLIKKGLPTDN